MHGGTKRSIPKEIDPLILTLEAGLRLLEVPGRRKRNVGSTNLLKAADPPISKQKPGKKGRLKKDRDAWQENAANSIAEQNEMNQSKIVRARSAYQLFLRGNGGWCFLIIECLHVMKREFILV